jgi:hypothetical protein
MTIKKYTLQVESNRLCIFTLTQNKWNLLLPKSALGQRYAMDKYLSQLFGKIHWMRRTHRL